MRFLPSFNTKSVKDFQTTSRVCRYYHTSNAVSAHKKVNKELLNDDDHGMSSPENIRFGSVDPDSKDVKPTIASISHDLELDSSLSSNDMFESDLIGCTNGGTSAVVMKERNIIRPDLSAMNSTKDNDILNEIEAKHRREKSKISVVHSVFQFDPVLGKSQCTISNCGIKLAVSSSSTSSQWNHVRRRHPSEYLRLKAMESTDDKDARRVTRYIVKSRLSFRHVESRAFQEFVKPMIRKIPSAYLLANKYLPELVHETRSRIKEKISGRYIAFTHDGFSDANSTMNLLSLTGHYIDENWDQHTVILACREMTEAHTSDYMFRLISQIMSEYEIELYIGSTADGASNMKCLVNKHLLSLYVHCGAHNLHLCLEAAFKKWDSFKDVKALKKFTITIHKSHKLMARYAQAQLDDGKKALSIPQPIQTRWNSICTLLRVIIDPTSSQTRFSAINKCIDNPDDKISDEAQLLLRKTFKFLECFDFETRHLSDNKTTASELIPSLLTLINHCNQFILETGSISELAEFTKAELERRRDDYLACDSILFTLFLDNRFVTMPNILPAHLFDKAAEVVIEKGIKFHAIQDVTKTSRMKITEETSRYASLLNLNNQNQPDDEQNLNVEIPSYINMIKRDARNIAVNPQIFRKRNQTNFPGLANLARAALSIPASSASSERLFSYVGLNMTERRENLQADTLEGMLLYSLNDTDDQIRQITAANDDPIDISQYLSIDDNSLDCTTIE